MSSLQPYNKVLGKRKAKHLLRRATFNFSKEVIEDFSKLTPSQALEKLFVSTTNKLVEPYDPLPSANPDGYWTSSTEHPNSFNGQGRKRAFVTAWWWYNAVNEITLKHKLSFFLHTSFTAAKDEGSGFSSNYFDHLRLLDFHAFGNLKTVAKKVTLDNSMLDYLDNTNNNASNPNENYAREFLELFTILKGEQIGDGDYTNYTELDVQMAAKVFSGFKRDHSRIQIDLESNIPMGYGNKNKHDKNDKIFSNAFDNYIVKGKSTVDGMFEELEDFIEMVFSKEATAKSYCRKLYRYFVKRSISDEVENDIIIPLSKELISNNYELVPVVRILLESQHFYDEDDTNSSDENIGAIVKSPLQLLNELISLFNINYPDPNKDAKKFYQSFFLNFIHNSFLASAGFEFFNPDSVAGYPAYYQEPDYDRHWFSSTTIISRYKLIESFVTGKNTIFYGNIYSTLDVVLFVKNHINEPSNPHKLVFEIAGLIYPEEIDNLRIEYFVKLLLDGYNEYYWSSAWNEYLNTNINTTVKSRLDALIIAMTNAAEFQLM